MSASLRLRELAGKRIAVWGLGMEGRAALGVLTQFSTPSSIVVLTDDAPTDAAEVAPGVMLRRASLVDPTSIDVIVKSPGVSPYHGEFARFLAAGVPVTGGAALWFSETGGERTIGVTGSKGKSTTSSLIAHLLEALNLRVVLGGNVGRAPIDVLGDHLRGESAPDWYVLELSSFQTAEVLSSPKVGVLTALFPEHLDWHETVGRYYDDKCNLFAHRSDGAVAVNIDNPNSALKFGSIRNAVPYGAAGGFHVDGTLVRAASGTEIVDLADSALVGRHNAVNIAGALAALQLAGVDVVANAHELQHGLRSFRPLAHRLERVGQHRGRTVVDDSLSTAPQAAVAALAAFEDRPVGIIVGGHDRGLDYQPLADALAARTVATWVCGVPNSGERIIPLIEETLVSAGVSPDLVRVRAFDDFDDAVRHAADTVPVGGVLLLSPAAPSFGRFRNYAERGMHFRSMLGLAPTAHHVGPGPL